MESKLYTDIQTLQAHGYEITKSDIDCIEPNSGSETLKHRTAKMTTAHVLWSNGFRVASEVERDNRFADIVGLGCEGRMPVIVEIDSQKSEKVALSNNQKYNSKAIKEVYTLFLDDLSMQPEKMVSQIESSLGF